MDNLLTEKINSLQNLSQQITDLRYQIGRFDSFFVPTYLTHVSFNLLPETLEIFEENKEDLNVQAIFTVASLLLETDGAGIGGVSSFMEINGIRSVS